MNYLQTELNYLNEQMETNHRNLVQARNAFYGKFLPALKDKPVEVVKKSSKTKKEEDAQA